MWCVHFEFVIRFGSDSIHGFQIHTIVRVMLNYAKNLNEHVLIACERSVDVKRDQNTLKYIRDTLRYIERCFNDLVALTNSISIWKPTTGYVNPNKRIHFFLKPFFHPEVNVKYLHTVLNQWLISINGNNYSSWVISGKYCFRFSIPWLILWTFAVFVVVFHIKIDRRIKMNESCSQIVQISIKSKFLMKMINYHVTNSKQEYETFINNIKFNLAICVQ